MKKVKKYWIVIILVIFGILTLIPAATSKSCYLGYNSVCTFTPISTIILWGFALLAFWRISKKEGNRNNLENEE